MKEFIKALFDEKKRISFQYKDYDIIFYAGEYHSFYLIFFLQSEKELMDLWKDTSEIFQRLKNSREIYSPDMDKNTMCIYCLEVSEEDYYQAGATGSISELSKKVSRIEEDLDYFAKHVFLYTSNMNLFSEKHIGEFDALCRKYIVDEEFDKYKKNVRDSYEYDFLINLFVKFPFLSFETYQMKNNREYQTVESFVQQKIEKKAVDISTVREEIRQLEEVIGSEAEFFDWLDALIEKEATPIIQREENP